MASIHRRYTTLILDLGDVLFRWSPKTETAIPPQQLKDILSSVTWFEYERGRLSQEACYERCAEEFKIEASVIAEAFKQARGSLRPNEEFIALIRDLRREMHGDLTVLALSNISLPDYEYIMSLSSDWTTVFDRVFPSALVGERKPHLGCYRKVISEMNLEPQTTVFVDDKLDNVASARSLGMHGIVFDNQANVFRQLRNIFGDPIRRGQEYLRGHAGKLESSTDNGLIFEENFTQLIIYELTQDRTLISLSECPRTWNFFRGEPLFSETFPDDVDTTSVALTVLQPDRALVNSVLDEMLEYVDADGIMQTYFDRSRPRMDPFVCVNVLSLFYENGRGHELPRTLDWVYEVLLHRAYHGGSRYYLSPDCFLFFMSRLLKRADDPAVQARLRPLFVERVNERVGAAGDSMDLAFRILAAASVGVQCPRDLERLTAGQCDDGGWDLCWFYVFGSTGVKAGNRGLTTALAVTAIQTAIGRPPSPSPSAASSSFRPSSPYKFLGISRPASPIRFGDLLRPWRKMSRSNLKSQ
ncbi:HAD-like protein [Dichomitus squalens LYAD-421 SS1]|uniref:HAD-like protein n=1 Tax=Dichomitus squalens (strain LYAD-421) TaxID=732165 RepID=R7SNA7_DICSQ|nr:HAD-like protein [Dichomitus squalens LYAD-421 SS1]EJF57659.1 HAD-like protein [Dichomitus squalens LYAD-421 SS1]